MKGIDLSNNNSVVNWDGVKFTIVKATESVSFVDKTRDSYIAGARSVGSMVSCYHFAHPDINSAKDEADHFLANSVKGDFGPCLDFETRARPNGTPIDPLGIIGVQAGVDWANEFLDRVEQVRQQEAFFYTFRYYATKMIPRGVNGLLWLSVMAGEPMFKTFLGRDVAIEQWGIVNGVDQNESYIELGKEEDMAAPITMVTPDHYKDANGNVIKNHPHHGEVWKSDGIMANHVASPHLVELYQYLGIAGPTVIEGEWFDDLTLLPNRSMPSVSQNNP